MLEQKVQHLANVIAAVGVAGVLIVALLVCVVADLTRAVEEFKRKDK